MNILLISTFCGCFASTALFADSNEFVAEEASFNTTLGFDRTSDRIALQEGGSSGWYIIPKVGVNLPSDSDIPSVLGTVNVKFDAGLSLGLALGMELTKSFALQVDAGYMSNSVDSLQVQGVNATQVSVDVEQIPIMFSGIWSNMSHRNKPYFGLGVGMSRVELQSGSFTAGGVPIVIIPTHDWTFAYQIMAGMQFNLSHSSDINIGYRFMHASYDLGDVDNHTFHLGLSFRF